MKNYVTRITAGPYVAKNNAYEEAWNVALEMDRLAINESELENFKKLFKDAIDKVNARNKRCKDLVLDIWAPGMQLSSGYDKFFISLSGMFQMEVVELQEISKEVLFSLTPPEPMDEAFNSGDGTYRP